jgi:hypothetical protein
VTCSWCEERFERFLDDDLPAYLVCYLVGAWCLVAAGFVLARHRMLDASLTLRDIARTVVVAIAGIFHVVLHVGDRGDAGAWPTLAGGVVIAYAMLLLSLLAAQRNPHER